MQRKFFLVQKFQFSVFDLPFCQFGAVGDLLEEIGEEEMC